MAFIEWTDNISVNDEIDQQHRMLFGIVNELHAAVTSGAERSVLSRVFGELIDYTIVHFRTEERLFAELSYPDAAIHKAEHDNLTTQFLRLHGHFEEGDLVITSDLLDFLHDWLMKHTGDMDLKFRAFLDAKK